MTQPLDLDPVQKRYEAAFETTWTAQAGETVAEFNQRVSQEQDYAYWDCAKDVPDLIDEIHRLRHLLATDYRPEDARPI